MRVYREVARGFPEARMDADASARKASSGAQALLRMPRGMRQIVCALRKRRVQDLVLCYSFLRLPFVSSSSSVERSVVRQSEIFCSTSSNISLVDSAMPSSPGLNI